MTAADPRCIAVPAAEELARELLRRCGAADGVAASVARGLVGAELLGEVGHGLRRLPSYAAQAATGKVDGRKAPRIRAAGGAVATIDAGNGFAFPALDMAVALLPALASEHGIAAAAICRSHHAGALGLPVERLAESGRLGLAFANTPAAIAPWGSGERRFGTNPVAFAAPAAGRPPLVVDLSLSRVARGKVLAARQRSEPIPEGWALDRDGRATTDPEAALSGSMLPVGGAKGAALAMMVELLAAGLTGARFGWEAESFLSPEGPPPGTGQLLLAIDPGAFGGSLPQRAAALAAELEAMPGVRLPGSRRHEVRERVRREGVPVDASLDRELQAFGPVAVAWAGMRERYLEP